MIALTNPGRRVGVLVVAALLASVATASAHVTAHPNEAVAGNFFQTALSITHGCDGSATVAVTVKLPEGVLSVKPQMKPGWQVTITKRKLATPQKLHGRSIQETVDEVTWRGGPLPDDQFDSFALTMKLPDTPGQSLYFPVTQVCEAGENRWSEIPTAKGASAMRMPAPAVRLKPRDGAGGGHAH